MKRTPAAILFTTTLTLLNFLAPPLAQTAASAAGGHAAASSVGPFRQTTRRSRTRRARRSARGNANSNGNANTSNANAVSVNSSSPARPKIISGGVLDGKAISKPVPAYPPIARAARAQGLVTVQVVVGEDGRVLSASAVSGHPLLQQSAVSAARQARFAPTRLSGVPVKVSGIITYRFTLD